MSRSDPVRIVIDITFRSLPLPGGTLHPFRMRDILPIAISLAWTGLTFAWLRARIEGWESAGGDVLSQRLLIVALTISMGITLMTALTMLQSSISGDDAIQLLMLPLTPGERFRIAVIRSVRDGRSVFTFLGAMITTITIGLTQPLWAGVVLVAAWLGLVAGSMVAVYGVCLWAGGTWRSRTLALVTILGGLTLVFAAISTDRVPVLRPETAFGFAIVVVMMSLSVMTGRTAAIVGSAYIRAVQFAASPAARHSARNVPGVTWLTRWPRGGRTAVGSMIAKDLLVQSRDWFFYTRFVVIMASLPLFLQVHDLGILSDWTNLQLTVCFVAVLTIYSLIDTSPSPIGSEGERLGLWLLAPTAVADLLWAKLIVYLLPLLLQSMVMVGLIGMWMGVSLSELLATLTLTTLMVSGPVTFLVWGSAFDQRMDAVLESGIPTTMYEHVPNTPQRLWLLNISVLIVGTMVLIVWRFPFVSATILLIMIDVLIALLSFKSGNRYLRKVI